MADGLKSLLYGIGKQSGSEEIKGAAELSSAIKEMADSFGDGNEEIVSAAAELQKSLRAAAEQAAASVRYAQKALRSDQVTQKEANAAIKRQAKIVKDLTEDIQKESEARELSTDDFKRMSKAVAEVSEGLKDEVELIDKKIKGEKALELERRNIRRAEKRDRERAAKEAADKNKEEAKSMAETLESRLGGAGFAGEQLKKVADKRGAVGVAVGVGLAAAVINKASQLQTASLNLIGPRAANYGFSMKNLNDELKITSHVISEVKKEAIAFGMEGEQLVNTMASIGAQTGASFGDLKKPMSTMIQLAHAGVASVEDLSSLMVYQLNTMGRSAKEAEAEIKALAGIGKSSSIQMDDFFKSVTSVAGAIDALAVDHRSLSKVLSATLRISESLGLSYDRQSKASQGLAQALSSSYDAGFATLNVQRDLRLAMKSNVGSISRDATEINRLRAKGIITDQRAAEMLKQVGGTSDEGVMAARMEEAVMALQGGFGVEMLNTILGTTASLDQVRLLEEISVQMKKGASFQEAAAKVSEKNGASAIDQFNKEFRERRLTSGSLAKASLAELEETLAQAMTSSLDFIASILKDIKFTVDLIGKFFGKDEKAIKRERRQAEEERKKERLRDTAETGTKLLVNDLQSLGQSQGWLTTDKEFIGRLATDRGLQDEFRRKVRGGIFGSREVAIREVFKEQGLSNKQIEDALNVIDRKRFVEVERARRESITKVEMGGGRVRGDGSMDRKVTLTASQDGAVDDNRKLNSIRNAETSSTSRQPR